MASHPVMSTERIHLSPPHLGGEEKSMVEAALDSNWIAPVGPNLAAFEREMCAVSGANCSLCVSSGTAALHLAVRMMGIRPGDEVFCSTFTFVASANPILYEGGRPVFIDAGKRSWNMDPSVLAEALAERARKGKLPRAIIVADIYGQCAEWDEILSIAGQYEVPVIEDAAESLGATYRDRWAGTFGEIGIYSFNGNKILTTSGGGMMLFSQPEQAAYAGKLSTQARESAPHYEHSEIGFNYRMSNILAAIGRGQLRTLADRIARRREIFEYYRQSLGDLPGVRFMPELPGSRSTRWLTCLTIDPAQAGTDRNRVLAELAAANVEARPLWKPLHAQPLFAKADRFGGAVSDRLFADGLCLPSGSAMTEEQLQRVTGAVRNAFFGI